MSHPNHRSYASQMISPEEREPLNRDLIINQSTGAIPANGNMSQSPLGSVDYGDEHSIPLQTMTICAADGNRLSEELANYRRTRTQTAGSPTRATVEGKPTVRFRTFSDPGHNGRRRHITGSLSRTASGTLRRMRHLSTQTFSAVGPLDENPQRGTWSNQCEFFLSCLGFAVGLGNVWRFPYLCYQDGGGAFLIPFILMLIFCGLPLLFLELTIGQYASEGPITIWKIAPVFKGLGIGMVMISLYLACYYNVVTGWAFYYLFVSLRAVLPWSCCEPEWENCYSFVDSCPQYNSTAANTSSLVNSFATNMTNNNTEQRLAASQFYFHRVALALSPGIDNVGDIQWHLFGSLFAAWALVFFVLMRGIKSFGKTVYFTSIFPYFVLVTLFIRSVIEEGAVDGIKFFLTPNFTRLMDAEVWGDALIQVFYSTSVCTGGIITLASYNRFHNNIMRDTLILGLGNCLTSIFSGLVVFSILGFMARRQNTTVDKIVAIGPGLTFITYPQAVTILPVSPLWSALFFIMLITLALSSMFPTVENITTAVIDQFPGALRPYKFWITLATCSVLFLFGSLMVTNGGMYILQLMDKYAVGWALVIIGLLEVCVLAWRYGRGRLYKDIEAMIGVRPNPFWGLMWVFVCPVLLICCLIFSWVNNKPLKYDVYTFPAWSEQIGWLLSFSSVVPVPIFAIAYVIWYIRGHPEYRLLGVRQLCAKWAAIWQEVSCPDPSWGPAVVLNQSDDFKPIPQKKRPPSLILEEDEVFG